MIAGVLIDGLENASKKATGITFLRRDYIVTLITGNGPAMMARRTAQ